MLPLMHTKCLFLCQGHVLEEERVKSNKLKGKKMMRRVGKGLRRWMRKSGKSKKGMHGEGEGK